MRRPRKSTFRPALEIAEARLLTTAGIAGHAAPHPGHAVVSAEAHHPKVAVHHPARAIAHPQTAHPAPPGGGQAPPVAGSKANPFVAEAWVELVNTTGSAVSYRISLAPYDGGKFHNFAISSGYPYPTQYQYAGLTASGPGSFAHFQIQLSGQAPVTLATGPSEASAQGYYILVGNDGLPYLSPMIS